MPLTQPIRNYNKILCWEIFISAFYSFAEYMCQEGRGNLQTESDKYTREAMLLAFLQWKYRAIKINPNGDSVRKRHENSLTLWASFL
jgi:hypothetical protein